jgi:DNA-binding LacI/PurR family transcriptional regulator
MPRGGSREKLDKVVADLRARIASGKYGPSGFLPSERVLAEELGVARNTLRAALSLLGREGVVSLEGRRGARVRGRSGNGVAGVILLILPHMKDSGVSFLSPEGMALLAGALCACGGSDIRFHMQGMPETGARGLVRQVRSAGYPGVLLIECHRPEVLVALRKEGIPHVVINQEHDLPGPATRVDFWGVGRRAADYLLKLGHRRLGALSGPRGQFFYDRMLAGFRGRAAEDEVYLKPEDLARSQSCSEEARAAALKLLSSPRRPMALLCTRDVRAYGAYLAARELGLRVPEDLSLVGYDDITWPGEGRRLLTTFPEPTREMGAAAIHMLTSWLRTGKKPEDVIICPDIIVRKSAAPCGAKEKGGSR